MYSVKFQQLTNYTINVKRGSCEPLLKSRFLESIFKKILTFYNYCDKIAKQIEVKTMDKIEEIRGRLAAVAHKESVDGSLKLRELGIDSLDIVELLLQLEEDYGVHFDDMDMSALVTVQDLLDAIAKQLK